MSTAVLQHDLEATRKILLKGLKNFRAKIYLFGSHATGKARPYSAIDVAVLPLQTFPISLFSEIREEWEESDIVRTVDVADRREAEESFRQRVEQGRHGMEKRVTRPAQPVSRRSIQALARKIAKEFKQKIILFGSYAY